MSLADAAFVDLVVLWMAIGTSLLAGIFLALELWAGRQLARRAPGWVAGILAAFGGASFLAGARPVIATGAEIIAAVCLIAWVGNFEKVQRAAYRLLTPKALWCLLLAAGIIASRLQGMHLLASVRNMGAEEVDLRDVPTRNATAVTDRGHPIPLFQFEMHSSAAKAEEVVLAAEKYRHHIIRVAEPSSACNCHGWIFTGGQFGIRNADVAKIVADNGYARVAVAQPGDLAIYGEGAGVTHSGRVRIADPDGTILVESKWGPFGVFLHPPAAQPFSGECHFYRSVRQGHHIALRREAQTKSPAK